MKKLTVDPFFEALCPTLAEAEFDLLADSIKDEGCRDPILVWANHNNMILDGHNRYEICTRNGWDFKIKAVSFANREAAAAWILRNQMGRRNLTDGQRAMMAAKLATLQLGANQHIATEPPGGGEGAQICAPSIAQSAAEFGVSPRTVQMAKKVLESGTEELQHAVESGDVSVSAAAEVADLPKAAQRKLVKEGPAAVKKAAKDQREGKPAAGGDAEDAQPQPSQESDTPPEPTFAERVKAHNLEIDRFARRVLEAFDSDRPASPWLDSMVAIARDQVLSACGTIRQAKAYCEHCPKCDGEGGECKACRGCGFMPKNAYEMLGGK